MGDRPLQPLALGTLLAIAAAKLALHLPALQQYGWFRDELYYAASTEHLDWGFVDHPPLSIAILALVRALFGDSLAAMRLFPILAGVGTVFAVAAIARQLGGGRFAQGLAALMTALAPVLLGQSRYYSMNALDVLIWALAMWGLLRALESGARRHWVLLGMVLGLGLQNKISTLWLGVGIAAALVLTSHRRVLLSQGPWLAGLIAAAIFAPHLVWQAQHGWPTLEFMRNATSHKMVAIQPLGFLLDQALNLNVGVAPIWIAGLVFGLLGREGAGGRALAWIWVAVLALLLAAGSARASYLAPAFAGLLALGAVALERRTEARRKWLRSASVALVVVPGLAIAPMALPLLPVETFVRYQSVLGLAPSTEERHEIGALPQHYADMFGWDQMVQLVSQACQRLTPEERQRCRVFGQNYGEAGAIDVLGQRLGLPRAISGHNSYWLWGPGEGAVDVLIIIGGDREDNAEFFEELESVGRTDSPWSMPYERGLEVWIARKPKVELEAAWARLKHYI